MLLIEYHSCMHAHLSVIIISRFYNLQLRVHVVVNQLVIEKKDIEGWLTGIPLSASL